MQITLELDNLPEGTTEEEVRAALHWGLDCSLDRAEEDEPLAEALLQSIPNPFETPKAPRRVQQAPLAVLSRLNSRDLTYLRQIAKRDHNDWQQGWKAMEAPRAKLKKHNLVTVTFYKAAPRMGDVDSTVCSISAAGRQLLKEVGHRR